MTKIIKFIIILSISAIPKFLIAWRYKLHRVQDHRHKSKGSKRRCSSNCKQRTECKEAGSFRGGYKDLKLIMLFTIS